MGKFKSIIHVFLYPIQPCNDKLGFLFLHKKKFITFFVKLNWYFFSLFTFLKEENEEIFYVFHYALNQASQKAIFLHVKWKYPSTRICTIPNIHFPWLIDDVIDFFIFAAHHLSKKRKTSVLLRINNVTCNFFNTLKAALIKNTKLAICVMGSYCNKHMTLNIYWSKSENLPWQENLNL